MASSSGQANLEGLALIGKNYKMWSIKMQSILTSQGYWEVVETKFIEEDLDA